MTRKIQSVADYIEQLDHWHEELVLLRGLLADTEMTEAIKWGAPCYTYKGKNVVGLGAFKSYFGLWFYQGALLSDTRQRLINAQAGKTKALRQWRMTSRTQIKPRVIRSYIKEALALVDQGIEIKPVKAKALRLPEELRDALENNNSLRKCFNALTPGRRREYAEHISNARQTITKQRRLDKITPLILQGVGLNDRYR